MTPALVRTAQAGLVLLAAAVSAPPARADYPDRNIDVIIPYAPGGGFDLYARAVARTMEHVLPKGVVVIPRNMPGAASAKGIQTMYRAAPDGYTFAIVDLPGGVQPQLLGEPIQYDLDQVTWLGVVNVGVYSLVVGRKSPFQTLQAFRTPGSRPPFIATTGSNDFAMARIAVRELKTEVKFLTGYNGGPDTHLAVIRGEADASFGIDVTIARHLASGDLKQLVWFQKRSARGAPADVPVIDDIGLPQLANIGIYRMLAAPPGLPDPVRAKLVGMVQAALDHPDLARWAETSNFPIDPGTPEQARRLYAEQKAFLIRNIDALTGR